MKKSILLSLTVLTAICLIGCSISMKGGGKGVGSGEPGEVTIVGFTDESNMEAAGAAVGDVFISYNSQPVTSIKGLGKLKKEVETEKVDVVLRRGDEQITLTIPNGFLGVYIQE